MARNNAEYMANFSPVRGEGLEGRGEGVGGGSLIFQSDFLNKLFFGIAPKKV